MKEDLSFDENKCTVDDFDQKKIIFVCNIIKDFEINL